MKHTPKIRALKHRWLIGLGLVVTWALVVVVFVPARREEPLCRGVPLGQWLLTAQINTDLEVADAGSNAIPALVRVLHQRDGALRSAYRRLWPKLPLALRNRLPPSRPAEEIREVAWWALRGFGPEAKPWLPELIRAAQTDPGWRCAQFSLNALWAIGADEPEVQALFRQKLCHTNRAERGQAAMAIYLNGYAPLEFSQEVLPVLPLDLSDSNHPPYNELVMLGVMGAEAVPALPVILEALRQPNTRGNALVAIRRIGPAAASAVPVLRDMLRDRTWRDKTSVAEALLNIGPAARDALPELEITMKAGDAASSAVAAAARYRITGEPEPTLSILIETLEGHRGTGGAWPSPERRYGLDVYAFNSQMTAVWFLGELGTNAHSALPLLQREAQDGSHWVQSLAAWSLWKIDPQPDLVLPILRRALAGTNMENRVLACLCLAEIGPSARSCLPDLEAACQTDLNTRRAARDAIRRIQEQPR